MVRFCDAIGGVYDLFDYNKISIFWDYLCMTDIIKICKKHGELSAENCYFRKNRNCSECRLCMRESCKKIYYKDIEKTRLKQKLYWQNNKESKSIKDAKYRNGPNRERILSKKREWQSKQIKYKDFSDEKKSLLRKKAREKYREISNQDIKKSRISSFNKKEYLKEWKLQNRDEYLKNKREHSKKIAKELSDGYLINLIRYGAKSIPSSQIPKELIELKRIHIKLKRKIKEKINVNK